MNYFRWKKYRSLTEVTIRKLVEYYKKSMLNNKDYIEAMTNAILATLYHCTSVDDKPQHDLCPAG